MTLTLHAQADRPGGTGRLPLRRRRQFLALGGGLALLLAASILSMAIGARTMSLHDILDALFAFDASRDNDLVIWSLRLPRTLIAVFAGAALGVAGAVMQAVTRNPLAEPGLLGINAGAAVAVIMGVTFLRLSGMADYVWCGFAGAGLAGAAVFLLGRAHEAGSNPVRLVLAGAGLSVVLGSLTGIVLVNAPLSTLDMFRTWSAGSVEGRGLDVAAVLAIATISGSLPAFMMAGNLNMIALGEDLGRSLGANVRMTWVMACLSVMVLAGAATAAAGPIGFVGLLAAHIARMLMGPDQRLILPCSALAAALLLLASDILGRVIAPPSEVAAGIVATLLGGPFLIAIARRFRLRQP
jgi:iron complex transport system permease protein